MFLIGSFIGLNQKNDAVSYRHKPISPRRTAVIKQPGIYWLQVKDANECIGKDSIVVHSKDCGKAFYMPTGFRSNNDGRNDLIKPILFGHVLQYRFWIYNRWGELIFESPI